MAEEIKGLETEKLTPQQQEQQAIKLSGEACIKEVQEVLQKWNREIIIFGDISKLQWGVKLKL